MNLIILAAGSGKRLYPLTRHTPKSLLDLGDGTTLLDRQLQHAIASNILRKVYVVTGYLAPMIEAKLEQYRERVEIETIYNPFYDVSNNLMSLWCAHYVMQDDDFLVSNGDNIYKTRVYDRVVDGAGDGIKITVDIKTGYDEDDMKVRLDAQRNVRRVAKTIAPADANAESVGLALVRGAEARSAFREALLHIAREPRAREIFWLEVFNFLVDTGHPVGTREIAPDDWAEIDFHPDVEAMRKAVFSQLF